MAPDPHISIPLIVTVTVLTCVFSCNGTKSRIAWLIASYLALIMAVFLFLPGWQDRKSSEGFGAFTYWFLGQPVSAFAATVDMVIAIKAARSKTLGMLAWSVANLVAVAALAVVFFAFVIRSFPWI